jgi:YgiT-type zinc finger domain-containing protein
MDLHRGGTWYGICPCGGTYEERTVEVRLTNRAGDGVTLPEIPQGACPVCGSRVYKLAVLQRIEAAMRRR